MFGPIEVDTESTITNVKEDPIIIEKEIKKKIKKTIKTKTKSNLLLNSSFHRK